MWRAIVTLDALINSRSIIRINPKLSECTEMAEEKFNECLERVDMKAFMENPTQALTEAGGTLKKGVTLQDDRKLGRHAHKA